MICSRVGAARAVLMARGNLEKPPTGVHLPAKHLKDDLVSTTLSDKDRLEAPGGAVKK